MREITIRIRRYRVNLDPEIDIFHVEVERDGGVWEETCPTREHLDMFIKGVRAGVEGYIPYPEIPETAELLPQRFEF
ncbi:MAG: hypothetical protein HYT39_02690 [Candidatus Sungbacteria bacterium]|nr:hypothetical protein [Candidatus Sungbacteria bacterium]